MSDPSPALVTASGLTKKYGDLVAVDGIAFEIGEGECFAFLGPNGAGKTSTIKMIHCVSPVTSGTLSVAGQAAHIDNRSLKKMTGVIPQVPLTIGNAVIKNKLFNFFSLERCPLQAGLKL